VADDIVTQLRTLGGIDCPYGCDSLGNPAADEIERLRAAGDALAEAFSTVWQACQCYTQDMEDAASIGFKAWEEASRA
jgi:hypothetical protein